MKTKTLALFMGLIAPLLGYSQSFYQYFDGADTLVWGSVAVQLDTAASNIWQIGPPQKSIFHRAATQPNALVTDTINSYPPNNTSRFTYNIIPQWFGAGILAIQWKQKLDMDSVSDFGMIEFSVDTGATWQNIFNNPNVYNLYGYDSSNLVSIGDGALAFSGTDTAWKDIWLCFDVSWISYTDSLLFRHTFRSDSIDNQKEGWIIDNLSMHITITHTINELEQEEYLHVTPNPTNGRVEINARKIDGFHIIEKMELINLEGKVVQKYGISPTKFWIDIGEHPDGLYFLKITTNVQTETFRILLQSE